MKRFLAIVGAVALVAIAFVVRDAGSGDGTDGPSDDRSGAVTVVCARELADICAAIDDADVRSRTSGAVADQLIETGEVDADVWITTTAWTSLVDDERARLGREVVLGDADVVASSALTIAIWDDRRAELEDRCDTVDWACLAETNGADLGSLGRVQALMPNVDSATGLVVAADQARSLTGRDDFASNDFTAATRAAATSLGGGQRDDPLATMRTRGPGAGTAAGIVVADAGRLSSNFGTIVTQPVSPIEAEVAIVAIDGGRGLSSDDRAALTGALVDAGWTDGGATGGDNGLPAGSVLAAVRSLWT